MNTPVVIYAAKSTEDKHGSIQTQLEDCRTVAAREGWDTSPECEFFDEAKSAYHGNRGQGLADAKELAVALAAEHSTCILLAQESDRFARGAGDGPDAADHLAELFFSLRRQGVVLWSVRSGKLDLLRSALEGERAHDETERKAEGVKKGITRLKARGKPFGGVPCGYKVERTIVNDEVRSERVIDPVSATTVETIFSSIEAGQSWGPIARALNERGSRTMRGNPWTAPVVRDLARNSIYVGEHGYPALIDRDRWDRIQTLITPTTPVAYQRRKGGRPVNDGFLLHGMAFCLSCGQPVYVRSDRGGYYTCRAKRRGTGLCDSRSIPARLADERVLLHLSTFVGSVEDWITERVHERRGEHVIRSQALIGEKSKLARLDAQRAERMTELTNIGISAIGLEVIAQIDQQRERQAQAITDTEALLSEWTGAPDVNAALDYYTELVQAIQNRINGAASVAAVNAALSTIVAGIWLGYDGHRLDASFALRPLDGRDDVGGVAQVLSASAPGMRWPLHPPGEGDPDEVATTQAAIVDQPETRLRSSLSPAGAASSPPP